MRREWVPSLSSRYNSEKNLQVGDIVLLISSENIRAHWPLGTVIDRKDGYVRSEAKEED